MSSTPATLTLISFRFCKWVGQAWDEDLSSGSEVRSRFKEYSRDLYAMVRGSASALEPNRMSTVDKEEEDNRPIADMCHDLVVVMSYCEIMQPD